MDLPRGASDEKRTASLQRGGAMPRDVVERNSTEGEALYPNPIIPVGDTPSSIAEADFNEDGVEDLAVANNVIGAGDISVLLGRGDGSFEPERRYTAGAGPRAVLAADFDADGHQDLAVANRESNDLTILPGHGDGTFADPISFEAGDGPRAIVSGDFNHDGRPDVAIANSYSSYISIFLSQSQGIFGPSIQIPSGSAPASISTGDFNNDGRLDLVVAQAFPQGVSILLATEDGSFGPPLTIPVRLPRDVGVGDFNADGNLDLAVASRGNDTIVMPGNAVILLGHGDGTFSELGEFPVGLEPAAIAVGDLDQDGRLDLAVANDRSDDVSILRGAGDGSFLPQTLYSAGGGPTALAVGDFNADGRLDLGVANFFGNDISILLNLGGAAFAVPDNRIPAGDGPEAMARADFNGDGIDDLVLANFYSSGVSILLGRGDGSFGQETRFESGVSPTSVAVADFNGDGVSDLAVLNQVPGSVSILLGAGDGTFSTLPAILQEGVAGMLVAADFNGDGWQDLAIARQNIGDILVLLGRGDGSFGAGLFYPAGGAPAALAVADFDGDGDLDLAVGTLTFNHFILVRGKVSILANSGQGTFGPPSPVAQYGDAPVLAVADFNADGRPDLVAVTVGITTVQILPILNLENEGFVPQAPIPVPEFRNPRGIAADDLDGDGIVDLAVSNFNSDDVSVLIGLGDGSFLPETRFRAAMSAAAVVTGDFNGDGRRDLAVANVGADSVSILLNQGGQENHPPVASAGADVRRECTSPAGAAVVLDGSASSDPDSSPGTRDDIVSFAWFEDFGLSTQRALGTGVTLAVTLPLGTHVITLQVTDRAGATAGDTVEADVIDTTPPVIALAATPTLLWPPNHRMVNVRATVTATDVCGASTVSLASITCSEADDAPWLRDGSTTGDIAGAQMGTADFAFQLRAERDAGGVGRVYRVTYTAVDASGNASSATSMVLVPHDLGTDQSRP
jgi:VCBS repeat protein